MSKTNYQIDIAGPIGYWGANADYVKYKLNQMTDQEVKVRVNSLGGNVNDGLAIAALFEEHGNVTVDMIAMNASAATVLAMGAKKIRIHANALFLIHKCMSWVQEFGYMNEDNINEVIENLQKEKNDNAKVDAVLAKMYAKRSGGKTKMADIVGQMKEGSWLSAKEALEAGFVDEVYEGDDSFSLDQLNTDDNIQKFNCAGLPAPPKQAETRPVCMDEKKPGWVNQLLAEIKSIGKEKSPKNQTPVITMVKNYSKINALLACEGLSKSGENIIFGSEQLEKINAKLEDFESLEKKNKELTEKLAKLEGAPGSSTKETTNSTDGKSGSGTEDRSFGRSYANAKKMWDLLD